MACSCPLCGNLHDRPAAAPKTASPATPQGDPVAKWMNAFAGMAADRDRHAGALRRLVLMARTSGGVAGHDDALCAVCDEAETVLTAARAGTAPSSAEVRTIWKFPIPIEDQFAIEMPRDAEILHVNTHNNSGCLWVRVVPERATEVRRFILRRTGHSVGMDCSHIGSFILNDGALAFHLFEPPDPAANTRGQTESVVRPESLDTIVNNMGQGGQEADIEQSQTGGRQHRAGGPSIFVHFV